MTKTYEPPDYLADVPTLPDHIADACAVPKLLSNAMEAEVTRMIYAIGKRIQQVNIANGTMRHEGEKTSRRKDQSLKQVTRRGRDTNRRE